MILNIFKKIKKFFIALIVLIVFVLLAIYATHNFSGKAIGSIEQNAELINNSQSRIEYIEITGQNIIFRYPNNYLPKPVKTDKLYSDQYIFGFANSGQPSRTLTLMVKSFTGVLNDDAGYRLRKNDSTQFAPITDDIDQTKINGFIKITGNYERSYFWQKSGKLLSVVLSSNDNATKDNSEMDGEVLQVLASVVWK